MKQSQSKNLVLFFTHDVSLQIWKDSGLLEREVRPYLFLAQEKGWKITFVTYGDDRDQAFSEALSPIEILPAYAGKTIPSSRLLRLFFSPLVLLKFKDKIAKASIYKTNQFWGGWNAVFARWLFGGKVIGRSGYEYLAFTIAQKQGKARVALAWLVDWLVYRFSDVIVVASQEDADFARRKFKCLEGRWIDVQPNWIDTDLFAPAPAPVVNNDASDLVYIGRLNAQKNLDALLEAVVLANCTLDIYGDGELLEALTARSQALDAKVFFKGRIANDRVPEILGRYEAFILPSFFEGNPKALLEAMACGKAVIATDVPGINSVIEHEKSGWLCGCDPQSLASAIGVVAADPVLRDKLGQTARAFVEKNNSYRRFLIAEEARLERCLKAERGAL
ncbi:MAG: glycosyltransferase family 4 protein [Alphaproteobacteria bacterium]|nr:glycosyltransferase family 4 protein [Alphaproteobacteria bacterium]